MLQPENLEETLLDAQNLHKLRFEQGTLLIWTHVATPFTTLLYL